MRFRDNLLENRHQFSSRGETQISRLLDRVGIAYRYEHPLAVIDNNKSKSKLRIWYPDFQLPQYGIIIEYFGLTGKPDYLTGMEKK